MNITQSLVNWYHAHKRELPWRGSREPYRVWISEIILQQTRVNQGWDYFLRFMEAFPTVFDLAKADEQQVLKIWQGLGYYSRARNLYKTAQYIVNEQNGVFPTAAKELEKLKGIGPYTAAAIASICFNEPVASLDGNVLRVLSRLFAIGQPVDKPQVRKEMQAIANGLIAEADPSDFNQAMMELGALVCTPLSPQCGVCPLGFACEAFKKGIAATLPVKSALTVSTHYYLYYFVFEFEGKNAGATYLRKRTGNTIWKNLYDFPSVESKTFLTREEVIKEAVLSGILKNENFEILNVSAEYLHVLTHRRLHATFIRLKAENIIFQPGDVFRVEISKINDYPLPRLIDKYLLQSGWV